MTFASGTGGDKAVRITCISHGAHNRTLGRLRYAPLLARGEHAIDLIAPMRWHEYARWMKPDPPDPRDVPTHLLPIRWANGGPASWHLHYYPGLKQLLRTLRPEVIHLWEEPWSLVTLHALTLRNRYFREAALVLEVDQNILKRLPAPFELIRRVVLREADWILARSQDAMNVARRCGYRGGGGLIGYGVDTSVFHPRDRRAARERFGLDGFTVGYVGRLVEEKGLDDLLDAAAHASGRIGVAILGEGPHGAALAERARSLGLSERVRFLPWCDPADVADFMSAIDALALVTRTTGAVREQFGRVIIEAQACGTPVIGSTSGAIPDVVGAGGWVVPERAPAELAILLDRLAGDPEAVAEAADRGRRQVAERFSYETVAAALDGAWHGARVARAARLSKSAPTPFGDAQASKRSVKAV